MHRAICIILTAFTLVIRSTFAHAQAFTSSNLPILLVTNSTGWPLDSAWLYIVVDLAVIDNGPGKRNTLGDPPSFRGKARIKIQGSSTAILPKKGWRIETIDANGNTVDVTWMGMPPHNDWVLKAQYQDKTLLRDDVTVHLYNQMNHYSSRSRFVEMLVNGEYKGVFELLEKIKPSKFRLDISKLTPQMVSGEELTGGYIIALDKYVVTDPGWYSKYHSKDDSSNYFLYEYPRPETMPVQQKDYIRNYVNAFEDALASPGFTSPTTGYRKYADVLSFIDQFIITELSRNVDGYRTSTFLVKDRSTSGNGKLQAIPVWDYNIAYGNCDYGDGNNTQGWQYTQYMFWNFVPFWWRRFLEDPGFRNSLRCRYNSLRSNVLSEKNIYDYIDKMAAWLDEGQKRNYQRWPTLNTVVWPNPAPVPGSYAGEIDYLKRWFRERLKWLDANIPGECKVSTNSGNIPDASLSVYPNPITSDMKVAYKTLGPASYVNFRIINFVGEIVQEYYTMYRPEGQHEEYFDMAPLPSGPYILQYTLNESVYHLKLVKL